MAYETFAASSLSFLSFPVPGFLAERPCAHRFCVGPTGCPEGHSVGPLEALAFERAEAAVEGTWEA